MALRFFNPAFLFAICLLVMSACSSPKSDPSLNINAKIITEDAERFAALFEEHAGKLTPEILQEGYLTPGTEGVKIFTPNRIHDADNLAYVVTEVPNLYEKGIEICLPAAQKSGPELNRIYAKYNEILDNPTLPKAYAVFGAGNSGGTAGDNAIVIGLEVICSVVEGGEAEVSTWLSRFFAHETAHVFQPEEGEVSLLSGALKEGSADFISEIVAGGTLNDDAAEWYQDNKAMVWKQFMTDTQTLQGSDFGLWLYAGEDDRPEGWPADLAYVIGADICRTYYEKSSDKKHAILDILSSWTDPENFIASSGYADQFVEP